MTDSEAWAVMGETIKCCRHLSAGSLCQTLVMAAREGFLEPYQWLRMEHQLYRYRKRISKGKIHFWPLGQISPVVRACYKLAAFVEKEKQE